MSKKGHNPWTRTYNGQIQKGILNQREFGQRGWMGHPADGLKAKIASLKLEKAR